MREGMAETFTINSADVPLGLHRCLATTNIWSRQAGCARRRATSAAGATATVLRWAAGAFLLTEKRFRRIMGYQYPWVWPTFSTASLRRCLSEARRPRMNSTRR